MLLASLFLAAFARSLASTVSVTLPDSPFPIPASVVTATIVSSQCDPTQTRTLLDVLYSCFGVILLCTYISTHHNIPDQSDSMIKITLLKLQTMLCAIMAPEAVVLWALRQRIAAGRIAEENKDRGWTRTHGFFVQMGGLVQQIEREGEITYQVVGVTTPGKRHVNWGDIRIPRIPEKEIKDRGKGDFLSKAIVVLQTTWFVAQCIARGAQGLAITKIEVITVAFAALNVIIYGLWWDKPLNVGYPIYFDENGNRVDGPVEEIEETWYHKVFRSIKRCLGGRRGSIDERNEVAGHQRIWQDMIEYSKGCWRRGSLRRLGRICMKGLTAPFAVFSPFRDMVEEQGLSNRGTSVHPFYASWMDNNKHERTMVFGFVAGALYGGIHFIGLMSATGTEWILWFFLSLFLLFLTLSTVAAYIARFLSSNHLDGTPAEPGLNIFKTFWIFPVLYVALHTLVFFFAFYSLQTLPESAYQKIRWTEFIPHI
ncbi:hypothetical protein AX16_001632 [Volvariella volvacea WC 439]|nr:hypothetical protein AX16_001632 [Volvariella volvacea WC 439]